MSPNLKFYSNSTVGYKNAFFGKSHIGDIEEYVRAYSVSLSYGMIASEIERGNTVET